MQCHAAAAALAERIAEREFPFPELLAGQEHLARDLERGVLEIAAADAAVNLVGVHPHPGAGLARRGAAGFDDQDFNWHIALRMFSGVAGASSGTGSRESLVAPIAS